MVPLIELRSQCEQARQHNPINNDNFVNFRQTSKHHTKCITYYTKPSIGQIMIIIIIVVNCGSFSLFGKTVSQ